MTVSVVIPLASSSIRNININISSNRINKNNNIIIISILINPIRIPDEPYSKLKNKDWTTMTKQDRTDQQQRT